MRNFPLVCCLGLKYKTRNELVRNQTCVDKESRLKRREQKLLELGRWPEEAKFVLTKLLEDVILLIKMLEVVEIVFHRLCPLNFTFMPRFLVKLVTKRQNFNLLAIGVVILKRIGLKERYIRGKQVQKEA